MSLNCDTCGCNLKIIVHGGEFLLTTGSTLEDINFEVAKRNFILATPVEDDEKEDMLTIEVMCAADPTHLIFQTSISKIKCEIFMRISMAAQRLMNKYYS